MELLLLLAAMLGGYSSVEGFQNDAAVAKVADFATSQIGEKENKQLTLDKVLSVEKQVVAGTNYRLKLAIADSSGASFVYDIVVFEALPHAGSSLELTKFVRAEGKCADDGVVAAARFAASRVSQMSNSLIPLQLRQVLESSVSGDTFNLKFLVGREGLEDTTWEAVVQQTPANDFVVRSLTAVAHGG